MRKALILTLSGAALLLWALCFQYSIRIPQDAVAACGGPISSERWQYGWPIPYYRFEDKSDSTGIVPVRKIRRSLSYDRLAQGLALWAILLAAILICSAVAWRWHPGILRRFHLQTGILVLIAVGALTGLHIESDQDIRFPRTSASRPYGWPVPSQTYGRGLTNARTPAGRAAEAVVVDVIFSLAILFCLAAASEWMLRRRSGAIRTEAGSATP